MKITKTTVTEYEVEPLIMKWHITVGQFISTRKRLGINSEGYEKCFICDKQFKDDFYPSFISVKGLGNMFACNECMKNLIQNSLIEHS